MPPPPTLPACHPHVPGPAEAPGGPTRRGFLGALFALLAGTPLLNAVATVPHPPAIPVPPPGPGGSPPAILPSPPPAPTPQLLNKVYVAGWQYHAGPDLPGPPPTPGEPVTLVAEPENPFDPFAVRLELRGQKVGYIPRTENHHLSRLLRAGAALTAEVLAVRPGEPPGRQVRVGVSLHR